MLASIRSAWCPGVFWALREWEEGLGSTGPVGGGGCGGGGGGGCGV